MSSHTGRTFLNSCLKVPIDPCNNCPAPIYNRPKMYLGRLSLATPMDSNITKLNTATKTSTVDFDSMWTSNDGIRSLVKLYDSIPDYCDINHLPEEEFYSTLDTLKTTCRELKTKSLNSCTIEQNSNTSSSLSSNCVTTITTKTKSKKSSKSKKSKKHTKKKTNQGKEFQCNIEVRDYSETPCTVDYKRNFIDHLQWKSCKKEFENEVEEFKRTLKEFERELIRPQSSAIYKTKSIQTLESKPKADVEDDKNKENEYDISNLPSRPTTSRAQLRAELRKAFSYNDINCVDAIDKDKTENNKNKSKLFQKLTKAEILAYKDQNKLSNYFDAKIIPVEKKVTETHVPKIIVDSPSSETVSSKLSSSNCTSERMKKTKPKKIKVPFTMFNLNSPTKLESCDKSTPSPVHPVARPNLAATLRAEVSRKKLQELQNNCTYHDNTPQVDWEVRKTPAWKSLSLNESHKEILSLRLATRKAEQALQQREYELNMEMMRQRVKSAPLLLEGMTFWGPNVGKLTHTCQKESLKHSCQSQKQRKQRRKNCTDRRPDSDSGGGGGIHSNRHENFSMSAIKLNALRKIYANSPKSYSRNSNRSARSEKTKKKTRNEGKATAQEQHKLEQQLDSGDDLSSVDRAFL